MIQFNLLPDVKLEYIRARRTRRVVTLVSVVVIAGSLVLSTMLFLGVNVVQKRHLNNLDKDVSQKAKSLTETQDLNKILTIQSQLDSLTALHQQKPAATRLFGYIEKLTPGAATISDFTIDFDATTVSITGQADTLKTVNTFADTLKFAKYKTPDMTSESDYKDAFSQVVLTSFGRTDKGATYTLTFSYDNTIFQNTQQVELVIPSSVTTRSVIENPLFKKNDLNTTN